MQSQKLSIGFAVPLAIFAVTMLMTATPAVAQAEKVLHSFDYAKNNQDSFGSAAGLILDADGNLYGTTVSGPVDLKGGTVFELIKGCWTPKVLHSFGDGADGSNPASSLIFDAEGNLYGTTLNGGAHSWGTVFELSPTVGGRWREKILHSFEENNEDGIGPSSSLIFDADGNLYGETLNGGTVGGGTVFELSPTVGGDWTEKVLHSFGSLALDDGFQPSGGLIFDPDGNLYGTTQEAGNGNGGTVFELSPKGNGRWTSNVLHHFGSALDSRNVGGSTPESGVIFDSEGNLYGTTYTGGRGASGEGEDCGCGLVFELTPPNPYTPPSPVFNTWTETVLHYFGSNATDGQSPVGAGVIFDADGNLYGTTYRGGENSGGTVFKLTAAAGGIWHETLLHSFGASEDDANSPEAGLIFDAEGNLYGTTQRGGAFGLGAVFEVMP
jgi:uncharacterized repeat protein (TIGR03803 family)